MSSTSPSVAGLRSEDPEERRRATSELSGFDPELVAEQVAFALADEDWRVRKEAVAVAVTLAPSPVMLEFLVRALFPSENVGLRNAAVEALGGYGQAAVEALGRSLPSLDADGRKLAIDALGRGGQPTALPVLSPWLADDDVNVRVAAAEAIAAIGAGGVSEASELLLGCLQSPSPFLALAALEGLNALGVPIAWSQAVRLLAQPMLRRSALLAAGRTGAPEAVPVLLDALGTARGSALGEVVCALRDLVREAPALEMVRQNSATLSAPVRANLIDLVADEDTREIVRRAGFVLVGALGLTEAADSAVLALGDDFFFAEAHEALTLLGGSAVAALVSGTHSSDALVRASCFGLLSRGDDDWFSPAALAAARRGLGDASPDVRCEALSVVSRFGDEDSFAEVVSCLEQTGAPETLLAAEAALRQLALRHLTAARRLLAELAAGKRGAHAACILIPLLGDEAETLPEALSFLTTALSDSSREVRRAAVEALAEVRSVSTVASIAFALGDEEREVRAVAIAALGRVRAPDGSSPGVPHLVALVQRSNEAELVAAAIRALGEAQDLHVLPVLRPLTRSAAPFVAVSAVEALAQLAGTRRVDVLLDGLSHVDAEVVKATLLALSETSDPRVVAHVGACLDNDAWDVRRLAADLLGRLSGESAHGLLRARLASEDSPPVQAAIARALERVAGHRKSTPPGSVRAR